MRFNQGFDRVGQFAETVDQLFLQVVNAFLRFAIGQALVNREPLVDVTTKITGQQGVHM